MLWPFVAVDGSTLFTSLAAYTLYYIIIYYYPFVLMIFQQGSQKIRRTSPFMSCADPGPGCDDLCGSRDGAELQHGGSGPPRAESRATQVLTGHRCVRQAFRRRGDTDEKRKRYDWLPWEALIESDWILWWFGWFFMQMAKLHAVRCEMLAMTCRDRYTTSIPQATLLMPSPWGLEAQAIFFCFDLIIYWD